MQIKIPYNLFVLSWCILGIIVIGYGFINDYVNEQVKFDRQFIIQTIWFTVFIFYCYNFFKNKNNCK